MSIFKKTMIAAAITGAFALASPAMAAKLTGPGTNGAPAQIVSYTVASGVVNAGASTFDLTYASSDNLAGRTTGFGVRFTLPTGVKFGANPTLAGTADMNAPVLVSGGSGSSEVVFNVTPVAGGLGTGGVTTKLTLGNVQLTGATALATVGGTISATAVTFDPNTAAALNTATGTLLQGANGLDVAYTPAAAGPKIDVGSSGAGNTNKVAKAVFSTTGAVNGTDVKYFEAGSIAITPAAGGIRASDGTAYAFAATDRFSTTLTGSFAGFSGTGASVTLDTNCAVPVAANTTKGTVAADGSSVAFSAYDITAAGKPGVNTFKVCFNADGKAALSATTVAASTTVTDGVSHIVSPADTGSLASMVYNGSSIDVPVFNPGGNTAQQSFLRISAAGQLGGLVTIKGVDDAGKASGTVTFNLAAGASKQLNSDVLANGGTGLTGSLGAGTGKWRLNVTGEFDKMVVQSLMRNNSSGTVTNLTDANVTN